MEGEKEEEEKEEKAEYFLWHGFRLVRPYPRTLRAFIKPSWLEEHGQGNAGLDITRLFREVFRTTDLEYVRSSVEDGRILVDGKKAVVGAPLREGQLVTHVMHRHETVVLDEPIRVLSQDENYVVVDKPATIPCHATGLYGKNSIVDLLLRQLRASLGPDLRLHVLYRLDRLVSGLLVLATNAQAANKLQKEISRHTVNKYYVACVKGDAIATRGGKTVENKGDNRENEENEEEVFTVDEPLGYDSTCHTAFTASEWATDREREGDADADADARGPPTKKPKLKQSTTLFTVLKPKSSSSSSSTSTSSRSHSHTYVLCMPITGRTHQIRVHLKHTGHPILNDHKYGGGDLPCDFGHLLRVRDEEAMHRLKDLTLEDFEGEGAAFSGFPCIHCPRVVPVRYKPRFDAIYLHCWKYVIRGDWSYECPLPEWLTTQVDHQEMQRAADRLKRAKLEREAAAAPSTIIS